MPSSETGFGSSECREYQKEVQVNQESRFFRYLQRETSDGPLRLAVEMDDDELMNPNQLRNACSRLKIDLEAFGLHLG